MAVIGIDLGTSNSAAAVWRGGRPVIIPSAEGLTIGGKAFPSYVALTADGQTLVGELARRQYTANPTGTTTAFKRKMGQRLRVRLRDREFSPEQLSALLLQKIKREAEAFLGEPVGQAVVTVPAYFDDNQRTATKDAAKIAGLEVLRLVNEPTAAALAYGLDRLKQDLRIAVVDLGGGTLDVTIMEFGKGVFLVKATSGDTQLGGTDMNQAVFEHLADAFKEQTGIDPRGDLTARTRLIEAAEIAKIELSASGTTRINLPFLAAVRGEPRHLDLELTRVALERIVRPVIARCQAPVTQALHDAGIAAHEIDKLVFVGGPTRMPCVRDYFEDLLHRKAEQGVDPMEVVAAGAAVQAGVLSGKIGNIVLVDVTPLTLGVETLGGVATPLIARNTPVPVKRAETFTTAADLQSAVTIHVFQGERPFAADNTSLGEFTLDGLAPAPRGVPKIEVTFDIDANGILDVSAKDLATGKSQSIRITASTRLTDAEKAAMIQEAEHYAEADKRRREDVDKLNNADAIGYQAEKTLADHGDQIAADLKQQITAALGETKEAIRKKDATLATERAEKLKGALQEVGKKLYAEAAAKAPQPRPEVQAPTGAPRPGGSGPRGKVVDAEFRETKAS